MKIHFGVVDRVYIAQLIMVYHVYNDIKNILNKKKKFRPTDPVKKLFTETGNKQLFFFGLIQLLYLELLLSLGPDIASFCLSVSSIARS